MKIKKLVPGKLLLTTFILQVIMNIAYLKGDESLISSKWELPDEYIFFVVEEVSKILKVTERTVLGLIEKKKLRASKVGRDWRISKKDLDTFLAENSNFTN
jgi:excisionase family DNA binding protein